MVMMLSKGSARLDQRTVLVGLGVALVFVILGVFCFSYAMETLDLKAGELGLEENPIYDPLFPDYSITGLGKLGELVVGVASTLLLFVITFVVAKLLSKKRGSSS